MSTRSCRSVAHGDVDVGEPVDREDLIELGEQPSMSQSSTKSPCVYSSTRRSITPRELLARLLGHVLALENVVAVLVDDLALLVHHVVVLEDALADEEVLLLDLLLGAFDLLGEHPGLDRLLVALVVGVAEAVEDP